MSEFIATPPQPTPHATPHSHPHPRRLVIIRTLPYTPQEMVQILAIRAQVGPRLTAAGWLVVDFRLVDLAVRPLSEWLIDPLIKHLQSHPH